VTKNRAEAPFRRSISLAAERQRRCRERRRQGAMVVQIVIPPTAINNLVRLGRLRDSDLADRKAVRDAFIQFARWALAHAWQAVIARASQRRLSETSLHR
jgi:hypothetical protein